MAYISFQPQSYFHTMIYSGDGAATSARTWPGTPTMQPDMLWLKKYSATQNNYLSDSGRGVSKQYFSNSNAGESTEVNQVKSYDSDGFTLGSDNTNSSGSDYAAWGWKGAGGTETTDSSADITVYRQTNVDQGISIIRYTGNNSTNQTFAHGLGAKPDFFFIKKSSGTAQWVQWHKAFGDSDAEGGAACQNDGWDGTPSTTTYTNCMYGTQPDSTRIFVTDDNTVNGTGDYMCYAFRGIKGFSQFGKYSTTNNTDGPLIYTGFRPALIVCVKYWTGSAYDTASWGHYDDKRDGYNVNPNALQAQSDLGTQTGNGQMDFLSNGFKLRTTDGGMNGSGMTGLYIAFAKFPFVSSNSIPTTAV